MKPETTVNEKKQPYSLTPKTDNPDDWKNEVPFKKTYTIADYDKLPEGAPFQFMGGKLIRTPAPEVNHQRISRKLKFKLNDFVEENNLGEVFNAPIDVMLDELNVFQPDIIYIRKENDKIIGKAKIEGPPDIVIEILSPSTAYYDLRKKYRKYEECGVNEYWIVDPEIKKIEVFENRDRKYILFTEAEAEGSVSSSVLSKFVVSLTDIF